MSMQELIWGVVGLLLTVMVLSYLIGDNLFFRIAGYILVGVTAGFLTVLVTRQILWPYLIQPVAYGSWLERLWVLIPLVLALLLVIGQFKRFEGAGRVPLAFLAGLTAAIAVGGSVFGTLIPQMRAVVDGFAPSSWYATPGRPWMRIMEAVFMLVGVLGTLSYFHFGRRRRQEHTPGDEERPLFLEVLKKVGEIFIGVTLGTVFAGIFLSALLAMIDRIEFIGDFIIRLMGGN